MGTQSFQQKAIKEEWRLEKGLGRMDKGLERVNKGLGRMEAPEEVGTCSELES